MDGRAIKPENVRRMVISKMVCMLKGQFCGETKVPSRVDMVTQTTG